MSAGEGDGHKAEAIDARPGSLVLVTSIPGGLALADPGDDRAHFRIVVEQRHIDPCPEADDDCVVLVLGRNAGESLHVSAGRQVWITEPW